MDVLKLWLHAQMQPISLEAWLGLDSAGTSGLAKLLLPRSHSFSKDDWAVSSNGASRVLRGEAPVHKHLSSFYLSHMC